MSLKFLDIDQIHVVFWNNDILTHKKSESLVSTENKEVDIKRHLFFLKRRGYEKCEFSSQKSSITKYSSLRNSPKTQVSFNYFIRYNSFGIVKYKYRSRINI